MSTINGMKTFMLLALMTALFVAVGFMIGGQQGMLIAFAIAAAMNLFAYWNSGSMVLRMYNAQEVGPGNVPDFYALVQQLAQRAGLPMPRVYIIDDPQPNAFATGRNPENAAVAATTGLLRALSREEIAGVMAHELAHVKNRDTLTMTVTATIAGAIGMLAQFGGLFGGRDSEGRPTNPLVGIVIMILAPIAAMLVQMWISRTREYEADALGAEICGDPTWLAGALTKIEQIAQGVANPTAEANPATAHMFIVNPLHVQALDGMFRTHPRTRDRVERLLAMAQGMRQGMQRGVAARPTAPRSGTFSAYGPRGNRRGPWG